jgi:short-subunit dehydrogenase
VTAPNVKEIVSDAEKLFGRIDFLVNNAGYAVMGAIEDTPATEVKRQMEANFYGPLELTKAVLPGMRERGSGMIVNISSAQGMAPSQANGIYAASKAALEAASEALSAETASFGIRVLIVEPGAYRTNFGGSQATVVQSSEPYTDPEHVVSKRLDLVAKLGGSAKGDPAKAAKVIFEAATADKQELLRLIIGPDCWSRMDGKVDTLRRTVDAQKELAASTDFS